MTTSFFSDLVRQVRERRKLSQSEFAKVCGVTQAAVANWEGGQRALNTSTLDRIATALGVSVAEMLREPVARAARLERRNTRRTSAHRRRGGGRTS